MNPPVPQGLLQCPHSDHVEKPPWMMRGPLETLGLGAMVVFSFQSISPHAHLWKAARPFLTLKLLRKYAIVVSQPSSMLETEK
jgi:hypothetical protein